jgi:hypothetical protein
MKFGRLRGNDDMDVTEETILNLLIWKMAGKRGIKL